MFYVYVSQIQLESENVISSQCQFNTGIVMDVT